MAAAVSPRAVDKRARPGNEATPAPTGPPVTTAEFENPEPAEAEVPAEVTDGARD